MQAFFYFVSFFSLAIPILFLFVCVCPSFSLAASCPCCSPLRLPLYRVQAACVRRRRRRRRQPPPPPQRIESYGRSYVGERKSERKGREKNDKQLITLCEALAKKKKRGHSSWVTDVHAHTPAYPPSALLVQSSQLIRKRPSIILYFSFSHSLSLCAPHASSSFSLAHLSLSRTVGPMIRD